MEKVVRKFSTFEAADAADHAYFRTLSGEEKLGILMELIMPSDAHEAVIERSARVYPLAQQPPG
jgi:hypothetical protein